MTDLYPLMFKPHFKEFIWGGKKLAKIFNKLLPEGKNIGESWEINDSNIITNGSLAGHTLKNILNTYEVRLVGSRLKDYSKFPVILKLSSAELNLSIQVHPDDHFAKAFETASGYTGKTEMIYVVSAETDARVFLGFNRSVSEFELRNLISKDPKMILSVLQEMKVDTGDVIFVPPGTIHAYGAGIVYFEIQQNSDLTYRIFDWERKDESGKPRELHIEKALQVIDYGQINPSKNVSINTNEKYGQRKQLAICPNFAVEKIILNSELIDGCFGDTFHAICILNGDILLSVKNSQELQLKTGDVVLIPACVEKYSLIPSVTNCQLIRSYIPDTEKL